MILWGTEGDEHSDLVSSVSADHVADGFIAARMIGHPGVRLDNELVEDEDCSAIGNHALNLPPGEDGILSGRHGVQAACGQRELSGKRERNRKDSFVLPTINTGAKGEPAVFIGLLVGCGRVVVSV